MKKLMCVLIVLTLLFSFTACTMSKNINGREYESYGFFNEEEKNPNIRYKVSPRNIIIAVIFSETLVVPIYVIGWAVWEPVERIH